jgi:hypothetical protein
MLGNAVIGQSVRVSHANRHSPTMAPWGLEGEPS